MKIFNTRTPDAINVENAESSFGVVKPRSVLIFGGGAVTGAYYLPAIEALGWSASTTVVESNASNLRELEKKFPLVTFDQSEFQNFFSSSTSVAPSDNGMAIVALPNHLHVDASRAALAAGFHVLCEKPLSNSPDECANLRSLAVRQRRLLKVAMRRRYLPSWKVARDIYGSGQLGAVQSVSVRDCGPFLWQPKSFDFFAPSAGGVLADMGTHYLDYLRVLLGLLEPVAYLDDSRGGNESSLKYELRAGPVKVELELAGAASAV